MHLPDQIIDKIKNAAHCCCCALPMKESKSVHFVFLGLHAKWRNPTVIGNLGGTWFRGAMAIICDTCIKEGKPPAGDRRFTIDILYAIEFKDGECHYHDVNSLELIK